MLIFTFYTVFIGIICIMYKKSRYNTVSAFLLFFFQIFRNRFNNNSRFKRFCKMFIHTCLNSSETILRKRICSHCDNRYCLCVPLLIERIIRVAANPSTPGIITSINIMSISPTSDFSKNLYCLLTV